MADGFPDRKTGELFRLGFRGRCPRCAEGRIFSAYLKLADACSQCGLKLTGSDVGDGPVVPVMLLIGGLIVGLVIVVEFTWTPPWWLHALIWLPLATLLVLLILPPIKGIAVALQHRYRSTEEDAQPGGQ